MIDYIKKEVIESKKQLETPYYYEHDLSNKHKHIIYGEIREDKITKITICYDDYSLKKSVEIIYFSDLLLENFVCYLDEEFKGSRERYEEALDSLYEDVRYMIYKRTSK